MIKLFRKGKSCDCEVHQLKLMEKAGWSKDTPDGKTALSEAEVDKAAEVMKVKVARAKQQQAAVAQGNKVKSKSK